MPSCSSLAARGSAPSARPWPKRFPRHHRPGTRQPARGHRLPGDRVCRAGAGGARLDRCSLRRFTASPRHLAAQCWRHAPWREGSHETCLLTLPDGQVVARLGGPDPAIEAAVMAAARRSVPVPRVLLVMPSAAEAEDARPVMILEHVAGTPLSQVLSAGEFTGTAAGELGAEVGRVVAGIAAATFGHRGFFADEHLTVRAEPPWSQQLPSFAATCMAATAASRLDAATRRAWLDLCAAHAPALVSIDHHTRLVHADINPRTSWSPAREAASASTPSWTGSSAPPDALTATPRTWPGSAPATPPASGPASAPPLPVTSPPACRSLRTGPTWGASWTCSPSATWSPAQPVIPSQIKRRSRSGAGSPEAYPERVTWAAEGVAH
jgi:hypothetical protein